MDAIVGGPNFEFSTETREELFYNKDQAAGKRRPLGEAQLVREHLQPTRLTAKKHRDLPGRGSSDAAPRRPPDTIDARGAVVRNRGGGAPPQRRSPARPPGPPKAPFFPRDGMIVGTLAFYPLRLHHHRLGG